MSFKLAEVFVELTAPTGDIDAQFAHVKRRLDAFQAKTIPINADVSGFNAGVASAVRSLEALKIGAGAALGALGIGAAQSVLSHAFANLSDGVESAARLVESTNKIKVVFGEASKEVIHFAETMNSTYGSNRGVMLDTVAQFGLVAKAAGKSREEAAGFGIEMLKVADDAASFYNVPLETSLTKIQAALVGQSRPIRAFGVFLNEDTVKAEAFTLGLVAANTELTEGQKVMARSSLIMKGLSDAAGDHARTADEATGAWREFKGKIADIGTSIGGVLLPSLNAGLLALNPILGVFQGIAHAADVATNGVAGFAGGLARLATGGDFEATPVPKGVLQSFAEDAEDSPSSPTSAAKKSPLESAKEEIARERAKAEQDVLVEKVRKEMAAADAIAWRQRNDAALYKKEWIAAEQAVIAARLTERAGLSPMVPGYNEAKAAIDQQAHTFAGIRFASQDATKKDITGKGLSGPDSSGRRDQADKIIAGFQHVMKDLAPQALGLALQAKQQGLGLLGKGLNTAGVAGEKVRQDRKEEEERRLNFRSERLSNAGLAERIQSAGLESGGKDKDSKRMVELQAQNLFELKNGFKGLADTLRQLKAVATYQ